MSKMKNGMKTKMAEKKKPKKMMENLSVEASMMEKDHEVQMARAQLYHLAENSIQLHKLLRKISEDQGLEGWVQSKITLASDYIESVLNYMEYEGMAHDTLDTMSHRSLYPDEMMKETTTAGAIATSPMPMGKMMRRK